MRYRFVQDVRVDGTLHVVTVRSQRASAKLEEVLLPEPPPEAVILRAADIPGSPFLRWGERRMPLLAGTSVAYVGEPVALVASPTLAAAQEMASAVEIRYGEALSPGSEPSSEGELRLERRSGDPGPGPDGEEGIRRELVTLPRRFAPPAPNEALALWEDGVLVVHTATQDPFHVRDTVSAALGLPPSRVRVIGEPLEGPGGRLLTPSLVAAHAALVAARSKRPARVRYSWREELGASLRIPGTRSSWVIAPRGDGAHPAARFRLTVEGGAWDPTALLQLERAERALGALYRYSALELELRHEPGSAVPCELPPGYGELEASLARELAASGAAKAAGVDPAEWRLRHLIQEAPREGEGARRSSRRSGGFPVEVLEEAMRRADFARKHAAWEAVRERRPRSSGAPLPARGIGVALSSFTPGLGGDLERGVKVRVSIAKDRSVTVYSSIVDSGRGWYRVFASVVGEALGLPASHVSVAPVDTSLVPFSGPTAASRTAAFIVPLLRRCCASLRLRMRRGGLPCSAESSLRAAPDPDAVASSAATVAGVEVDPENGRLRTTGVWCVIDAGAILDQAAARAAALAALVRGIGIATRERSDAAIVPVPPISSALATPSATYGIAERSGLGPLEVSFLDRRHERGGPAPRGVSEVALLGVAPALAGAVAQALGRPVTRIPMLPEDLAQGESGTS